MNFDQLVNLCHQTHVEMHSRAVRSVDLSLVVRNWLFGRFIIEFEQHGADRAEYGAKLLSTLSERLKSAGIRGAGHTNLKQARQFYVKFGAIGQTVSDESQAPEPGTEIRRATPDQSSVLLSAGAIEALHGRFTLGWSHYVELLTIDSAGERRFYEIEAAENQWSVRELRRQIDSSLYERLALSRDKADVRRLAAQGQVVERPADLIKNPFVLEFLGLAERPHYTEDDLESAIIDKLQAFLLELGKGFLFEARQKRFTFDNDHYRIDLVFYNRLLRCYVLLDLKRGRLTHQDLGQMQMYVNYYDRHVKLEDELPTVGMVLCHDKNDTLVELTLPKSANIFASKYQLYLPSKEEMKTRLEEITRSLEGPDGEW